MGQIEDKIASLGLILPEPQKLPPGVVLPFPPVNIRGRRAIISGHGPQEQDGTTAGPFGQLGRDVTVAQGRDLARMVGLSILGSLKRALGDLDRIQHWDKSLGMVNSAPDFTEQPAVINGFTELILEVFGDEAGRHARSAVGMAALPFNIAVEIEAEVTLKP